MFIILLAQFDSIYNSILVLLAVILSVGGVLVGMMVMGQSFSIIMTGIGIVALAGIVVNNNIVLIDTFQEFRQTLPDTGVQRLRPVILTTITTMAGLLPMMFAISIDFKAGGISVGAPSAMMWTQLATAIVFGLGFATVLTLVVTPSLLALRVWWFGKLPRLGWRGLRTLALAGAGQKAQYNRDRRLTRKARRGFSEGQTVRWDETVAFGAQPSGLPVPAFPDIPNRAETRPYPMPGFGTGPQVARPAAAAAASGFAPALGAADQDVPDLSFLRADMTPTLVWSEGMPLPPDDPGDGKPPFTQAAE
jgi:multidrug efflux pump